MIDNPEELKRAVERLHGCTAQFIEAVEVDETFQGQTVWHGIVHVFDIQDHPQTTRCYAWSSPIEGTSKRKFFAVLEVAPVKSAQDAVRVAIVQEFRTKG